MQKFKNLYSTLLYTGRLPAGGMIVSNGDGIETAGQFFFKSLKFNGKTPTEKVFLMLLKAYRNNPNLFTSDDAFGEAVEIIQDEYETGCLDTEHTTQMRQLQIQRVANMVRAYINDDDAQVPANIYEDKTITWSSTFFGGKKAPGHGYQALSSTIEDATESPLLLDEEQQAAIDKKLQPAW